WESPASKAVQQSCPYGIVEGPHGDVRIKLRDQVYSVPEVSAFILQEMKLVAEQYLGGGTEKAVITVPAYFNDNQRQATKDAGRIAGLDVIRIINEPTAAALAYGFGKDLERRVAVYDLGGGTFDISILRLIPSDDPNTPAFFQVLATAGDTRLGGDDVDQMLVALFIREINEQLGTKASDSMENFDPSTRRALIQFAQSVKHKLSTDDQASIEVSLGNNQTYTRTISRTEFEEMIGPWVARSLDACRRALRDASRAMGGSEIDAVVMVGGSIRIPMVQARVGEFFGRTPYTALDPDRIVALGAAVQGAILAGTRTGELLVDVIPLSLGIETAGGAVAKLIMRNSPVPARATERFSTSVDGQTNIKLQVLQGEREMVEDCRSLGTFELRGIPPMPAGIPKLVVEFLVDANGFLSVSAIEERSGKRASIQIVPNHGLTKDEVDRMEAESITHAREDMTRHQIADLIVNAKLDLKWIGDRFKVHKDALDDEYRSELQSLIDTLGGFVDRAHNDWSSVNPNDFHIAKETLDHASIRLQEISIAASLRNEND
ncbi:MAG: Hsp70 family protein, partial [Phycisphaerales bacterium]|nr:Hsp70 family protein [Phycisphaerales bacterium]